MSYCQWSDDCFQSDVYCFESEMGFQIYVASKRHVSNKPRPPRPDNEKGYNEWFIYYKACIKWAKQAEIESIGLPCDGKSYLFDTASECLKKLIRLRETGYRVPQHAIDALSKETEEQTDEQI